ncbi:hypothetical protein [Streptomyces sp. RTd22]|uniref:hypothetical protein n=1 Tax=Streptomyces sp. RTd22 TaxID=1841249 RepID=UPI00131C4C71|nr:hypothetical protein [Streptomyces sp. RTd22]
MTALDWLDGRGFNLLTIVIALLALIAGIAGVLYARRALFPANRAISYRLDTSRLLAGDARSLPGALTVSYEGQALQDPYVVKLRLRNTGRHAVASEHYDRGRPIKFVLGRPAIMLANSANGSFSVDDGQVSYGPELLPAGRSESLSLITEGKPSLTVEHYFIDTKVIDESPESDRLSNRDLRSLGMTATAAVVASLGSAASALLDTVFFK